MKIAWLTPFSRRSAIGQCSAIIVKELRAQAEVAVFAPDLSSRHAAWLPDGDLRFIWSLSGEELLREIDGFDMAIYNLGDYLYFHREIYEAALARPGITVLHDLVMHHFFTGYYLQHRTDPDGYVREVAFSHGEEGERFARAVVDGRVGGAVWGGPQMLRFHMARSALHGSDGVVVHSEYARRAVAEVSEASVIHIPFPTPPIADAPWASAPRSGGAAGHKLRLLTFGMINPNKMVAEVIRAIGASDVLRGRVTYDVLGSTEHDAQYADELRRLIGEWGLDGVVALLGRRSEDELHEYLRGADVVINLRNPHFGESSWSLLESTFLGTPTVVWKHGFYDEFPDDAVAKVINADELRSTLERLCRGADARVALGDRAREYARRTFSTAEYCRRLLDFAERTRYNRPVLRLTDTVASMLLELGETSVSASTALVADELSALGADNTLDVAAIAAGGNDVA